MCVGGFLRQFLVDDKGCVLIAMWGTPSFTYSNNCSRALRFAVSLVRQAGTLGHKCSAGVTTGMCGVVTCILDNIKILHVISIESQHNFLSFFVTDIYLCSGVVFCGTVGAQERCDYAGIGEC